MKTPQEIVEMMMSKDYFSQWMGIEVLEAERGTCKLRCKVREEMLNGFGILHGGISYSLSDSALAFASNSYGKQCVSVETSIAHTLSAYPGDELTIEAEEKLRGKTIGIYIITITNQEGKLISRFKGTVHISDREW